MINRYKYNDNIQLTKNFNSKEFNCKGKNHTHDTLIDANLVNQLQIFMNKNGYTKAIISSGYRCKDHNKVVSGSANSQHTKGTAVDICFYKDGKPVDAKEVCCKAQDFGFKGIAYIDKYHVHLDNRASGIYRGDERKGYSNNIPNNDFYAYFNIKHTYRGIYPILPARGYFKKGDKGIEVKHLQEFLNWATGLKLKVDGIIGDKTIKSVKEFQRKVNIKEDGLFGRDSLKKAKEFKN